MALERLTLTPVLLDAGGEDMNKPPRLPRWTRQELLVLIQGKRVAENRVRRGRTAVLAFGSSSQVEPKWSSVSSYCKRHGVHRGPVQCRKRWSNLAGDFKKIKEWESQVKEEAESFWVMRNDLRRERKLPGFFDREVYDILDGGTGGGGGDKSLLLSLAAPSNSISISISKDEDDDDDDDNNDQQQLVFDSGRTTADDALFSDDKDTEEAPTAPTPISVTQYEPLSPATTQDKQSIPNPEEETHEEGLGIGRKRKRPATETETETDRDRNTNEVETSLQNQLIQAMERNGRLLSSQLEIQNTNSQLDREQRKDHANNLFAVLNKLADAMVRIADKL